MSNRNTLVLMLLTVCGLCVGSDAPRTEILRKFGAAQLVSGEFRQEKHVRGLRRVLRIEGEFYLDRAGRFAWRVKTPLRYNCVMEKETLKQWDADTDKVVVLEMRRHPALSAMADAMRMFFSGSLTESVRDFEIRTERGSNLILTPRKGSFPASVLESVRIESDKSGAYPQKVILLEKNGDRTEIVFEHVRLNAPIPDSAWEARTP